MCTVESHFIVDWEQNISENAFLHKLLIMHKIGTAMILKWNLFFNLVVYRIAFSCIVRENIANDIKLYIKTPIKLV